MIGMATAADGAASGRNGGLWCRTCDEPAERRDGKFVHAATGLAEGQGGHLAVPSATDPAMKAEARKISEEFGGRWQINADLSVFYAIPNGVTGTPVAVDAATGNELQHQLAVQESIWRWARR
jgi:hypothetical protein